MREQEEGPTSPIGVFYSYAREDIKFHGKLRKHLSLMRQQGIMIEWHDRKITPGSDWAYTIDNYLSAASIILLLISPDFLASDYCYGVEMQRALERQKTGEAHVIPILVRPVDWERAPFAYLQCLPRNKKPITQWRNQDEALTEVTKDIRAIIEKLPFSGKENKSRKLSLSNFSRDFHLVDWGEAPRGGNFYAREQECFELKRWIRDEHCRVIAVLGIGGIGKTALTANVTEQIQYDFSRVFWRTLQNAPPLKNILEQCMLFITNQQKISLPKDVNDQINLLMKYLSVYRCLLILDNFETVLQPGEYTGQYRKGYEGYGQLLKRLEESQHQSCLLLTSREKPQEIALLEGDLSPVRSLFLHGLELHAGREILREKGLFESEDASKNLLALYSGNPLALKLVSATIRDIFQGNISAFLDMQEIGIHTVYDILNKQFERLSPLERDTIIWLSIERELSSLHKIYDDMAGQISKRDLMKTLESLLRRSIIELNNMLFTLQPVVMEYVTEWFIEQISKELERDEVQMLGSHALIMAQAKDYVRNSQIRIILTPIIQRVLASLGKGEEKSKFKRILSIVRKKHSQRSSYAGGNLLNLLVHLEGNLSEYDFSYLTVRQAYLQGAILIDVNFAYTTFAKSTFTDIFGGIVSVAYRPDGEMLVAGTMTGDIRAWQARTGTPLLTYKGHTDNIASLAFSPDGQVLASGCGDGTIRIWNVNTSFCLKLLQGDDGYISSVAFSPNGTLLASSGKADTIRLWNVHTGDNLSIFHGHVNSVLSVAFSPDGEMLVSGGVDHTIRIWNINTGENFCILQGHSEAVRSVAFSPCGKLLASGSADKTIRLWNISNQNCLHILDGHKSWIRTVSFSPDGKLLASSSDDETIRLWNIPTGRCLHTLQGHRFRVQSVAFSPDGVFLASGGEDRTVCFWEVCTGYCLYVLHGYTNQIWAVALSPDGVFLASGGEDRTVHLWKVSTWENIGHLQGHSHWVRAVAFSPDGTLLASGSADNTIRLWETNKREYSHTLQGHSHWVRAVAFSPDGTLLASGSADNTIRLWEVDTGQCLEILEAHSDEIMSVTFSPDGKLLASSSGDQSIRLWRVSTWDCVHTLQGHHSSSWGIWSLAFNPSGTLLASGGEDETIRLWEVSTGRCLRVIQGQVSKVWSVAFSPDGTLLAGSDNPNIHLWQTDTGNHLKTLSGHTDRVRSIIFRPDSNVLISGSQDGTIKVWDTQTGICIKTLMNERPYERMNITGATGLTNAQKNLLKALGAVENKV